MTPNDTTPPTRDTADRRLPDADPLRDLAFVLKMTARVKAEILAERPAGRPGTPHQKIGSN